MRPISWSGVLLPSARQKPRPVRTSHSMSSFAPASSVAISRRGLRTSTEFSSAKSPAVTVQGPSFFRRRLTVSRVNVLSSTRFRLRMMSVTSSATPGIVENSWLTPAILTEQIAQPSMEERSTRRSEFPIVRA